MEHPISDFHPYEYAKSPANGRAFYDLRLTT